MSFSKQKIALLALLIFIALLGLVVVQLALLRHARAIKQQAFQQNVNTALLTIADKLESIETVEKIFSFDAQTDGLLSPESLFVSATDKKSRNVEVHEIRLDSNTTKETILVQKKNPATKLQMDSTQIIFWIPERQKIRLKLVDSLGRMRQVFDQVKEPGKHTIDLDSLSNFALHYNLVTDSSTFFFSHSSTDSSFIVKELDNKSIPAKNKKILVTRVVEELLTIDERPIMERINPSVLDSLIRLTCQEKGIDSRPIYAILTEADSILVISDPSYKSELLTSSFRTALFPRDLKEPKPQIVLAFPFQERYLLRQSLLWGGFALLFLVILSLSSAYALNALHSQKRTFAKLTDFINNMTHEFKTPLTTISIASEEMGHSLQKKESPLKYNRIISNETSRLRALTDKILEVTVLEQGELELNPEALNIHSLLQHTVNTFSLQIKSKQGHIRVDFQAENFWVRGDKLYMQNIFNNIVDNAIKYCDKAPEIDISTETRQNRIRICIQDNGIGLTAVQQKHVFEKYYRVPTGNRHDVKGFGLGLTFVELLTKAQEGTVDLSSKPGKGSMICLSFPVIERNV